MISVYARCGPSRLLSRKPFSSAAHVLVQQSDARPSREVVGGRRFCALVEGRGRIADELRLTLSLVHGLLELLAGAESDRPRSGDSDALRRERVVTAT